MKKVILYCVVITTGLLLYACSNSNSSNNEASKNSLLIGHVNSADKSMPQLDFSLPEVISLMDKNNGFAEEGYDYSYENAWIEVLKPEGEAEQYYLAVSGEEKNQEGKATSDSYTIYSRLVLDGGNLMFVPGGDQDKCAGHCCSSCNLKPHDQSHPNAWCDCTTPATTPACENEARCDHSQFKGGGGS